MSRVSLATGELSGRQAHSVAFSSVLDAVRRVFMVGVVAFFHKNKLKKSIKKNLLPEANAAVDFMMFFSPEEDGWISVLVEVDREEWPWDLQILKKDWALASERKQKYGGQTLLTGFVLD